jgi:predicted Rossmann fold nucleotide-binding protein DprA/Smf involved in DNA uptake
VPGNIDVDSCKGSNALLRAGAIAVSSGWDVVSEYEA